MPLEIGDRRPLAHSAPEPGKAAHAYADHISAVARGAGARAEAVALFARDSDIGEKLVAATVDGATFHDIGKLDCDNQTALRAGRKARMPWDHIDAGVAHLMAKNAGTAAWAVRAHHAPGLPSKAAHFVVRRYEAKVRPLRGRRNDDFSFQAHVEQVGHTDLFLPEMLALHRAELGDHDVRPGKTTHGLTLRLALSCLVDADHSDTAFFETGRCSPTAPPPRWSDRLVRLDAYVAGFERRGGERDANRDAFYQSCRTRPPDASIATCQGPVGIGKTTAVLAYLLRRAIETGARRLFVIAPFTAILSQTADVLRKALVLPGEQGDTVVAEHHHRADFETMNSRDLAVLWSAPVILTTAVQFFETLASNAPARLRKLHALPGSVVFIDEAHAAVPTSLWPQNWLWIKELVEDWGCSYVFASGSLARFWTISDIVGDDKVTLPDLAPEELTSRLNAAEGDRVSFRTLGRLAGPDAIEAAVTAERGPRLLIFNTVQSAAVMARHLRGKGRDVLHISTALCPSDREAVLLRVRARLDDEDDTDWTLVATSLVEAGVNISFGSAFRERFSAASLVQVSGRVNRHGEAAGAAATIDFFFDADRLLKLHPGARTSAAVLTDLLAENRLHGVFDRSDLVTSALQREIRRTDAGKIGKSLSKAEKDHDYPEVAKLGRVIDADTRLVVVKSELRDDLKARRYVSTRDLLSGSLQIWTNKIEYFGLQPISGREDVFWWPHAYDSAFLGYMEGVLGMMTGEALII